MEKKLSKIKKRILQFIEYKGYSKREFYRETGISNGSLDSSSGVTEATIEKLLYKYPEISPAWLVSGLGKMFLSEEEHGRLCEENIESHSLEGIMEDNIRFTFDKMYENLRQTRQDEIHALKVLFEKGLVVVHDDPVNPGKAFHYLAVADPQGYDSQNTIQINTLALPIAEKAKAEDAFIERIVEDYKKSHEQVIIRYLENWIAKLNIEHEEETGKLQKEIAGLKAQLEAKKKAGI